MKPFNTFVETQQDNVQIFLEVLIKDLVPGGRIAQNEFKCIEKMRGWKKMRSDVLLSLRELALAHFDEIEAHLQTDAEVRAEIPLISLPICLSHPPTRTQQTQEISHFAEDRILVLQPYFAPLPEQYSPLASPVTLEFTPEEMHLWSSPSSRTTSRATSQMPSAAASAFASVHPSRAASTVGSLSSSPVSSPTKLSRFSRSGSNLSGTSQMSGISAHSTS
jgi:hypothetical protein